MRCRCCNIELTPQEERLRKVYLPTGEVILTDACLCSRCWDTDKHDQVHEYKLGDHIPGSFYHFDD